MSIKKFLVSFAGLLVVINGILFFVATSKSSSNQWEDRTIPVSEQPAMISQEPVGSERAVLGEKANVAPQATVTKLPSPDYYTGSTNGKPTNTPPPLTRAPTSTPYPATNTPVPTSSFQNETTSSGYVCNCSKTCPNLTCDEAYFQLNECGCGQRDGDNDGVPCENVCE